MSAGGLQLNKRWCAVCMGFLDSCSVGRATCLFCVGTSRNYRGLLETDNREVWPKGEGESVVN